MDLEPEPEIAFQQQLEHIVTKHKKRGKRRNTAGFGFLMCLRTVQWTVC